MQAVWVRKIYELYASGHKVSHIVRYLHDNGVHTGRGGIFDRSNIYELIHRTAYKGMVATNKRKRLRDESRLAKGLSVYYTVNVPESEWTFLERPRIVSDDLWNATNERLNRDALIQSGRKSVMFSRVFSFVHAVVAVFPGGIGHGAIIGM